MALTIAAVDVQDLGVSTISLSGFQPRFTLLPIHSYLLVIQLNIGQLITKFISPYRDILGSVASLKVR